MPAKTVSTESELKAQTLGREYLPDSGVLVIPNRLSFHDLLLLERELRGRDITYLIEGDSEYDGLLKAHLERDDVEGIEFACDKEQLEAFKKEVHGHIAAGRIVVLVPGAAVTCCAQTTCVPTVMLKFMLDAGAPVVPLFVDHPKDTRLSIESIQETDRVVFSFGKVLEREAVNLANYLENLLVASEEAFSQRNILKTSLAFALLRGLKKHATSARVIDGVDGEELGFDKIFAAAAAFSKQLRKVTGKKRVGILLPPGRGGLIANLAVLFAGKIPVNLNFTAGAEAVAFSIEEAELDRFITAQAFIDKLPNFPWPAEEELVFIERVLAKVKGRIKLWYLCGKLFSARRLARMLRISEVGGREEAMLLFTSGSSGKPKGVVLSSRNLLANINQFGSRIDLCSDDRVLGCLPLFHSFGATVTMWYPLIEGVTLVTYPSPLDIPKLAQLIEHYKISLILSTPTFLRGYLRKAKPEQLRSAKLVVTGAEKLPSKIAEAFEKRFGKPVLEGYGLTETAPATNVNLPNPQRSCAEDRRPVVANHRPGSVGQLIPGIAARITDPETDQPLSIHSSGMIWLKGANIFEGYLNQPEKTGEVLVNGWFRTGDLGRMDEEGFLYIEGRLSRFSKIGGEMVPHETVEDEINAVMGFDPEDERKIVVVGVPDEQKGEALVVLTAESSLDKAEMRSRLLEKKVPALWIPKSLVVVDEIPHLASGKLDIKSCEQLALASK
jgi:acyl-[acyl-carrier-protein]-phospholipid O-acyltransferase/long-chain-fatty-acid--[acyl-carrier-protein] ligase